MKESLKPHAQARQVADKTGKIDAGQVCGAASCHAIRGVSLVYSLVEAIISKPKSILHEGMQAYRIARRHILKEISKCINQFLMSMDADAAKLAKNINNNNIYKKAVESIWKDKEASSLILTHTNAFYIRKDDKPCRQYAEKGANILCEVCIDDPLVRSELDTHRELLQFALRTNGLTFDELRIIPSKGNMRKRHPFKTDN